jgi:hypothetical protein
MNPLSCNRFVACCESVGRSRNFPQYEFHHFPHSKQKFHHIWEPTLYLQCNWDGRSSCVGERSDLEHAPKNVLQYRKLDVFDSLKATESAGTEFPEPV